MRSKIQILTYTYFAEVESDEEDRICKYPVHLEWAKGIEVNAFKEEIEKTGELISWDETFIEDEDEEIS